MLHWNVRVSIDLIRFKIRKTEQASPKVTIALSRLKHDGKDKYPTTQIIFSIELQGVFNLVAMGMQNTQLHTTSVTKPSIPCLTVSRLSADRVGWRAMGISSPNMFTTHPFLRLIWNATAPATYPLTLSVSHFLSRAAALASLMNLLTAPPAATYLALQAVVKALKH
jgi:hypothetical protein